MKWVALIIALAMIWPLAAWLRRNRREIPKVWLLVGLMPFALVGELDIAVISWPEWPGFAKGFLVTALVLVAVVLYLSLPRRQFSLPFRLSMTFYLIAVVLSITQASVPFAGLFYIWQLARMFLIYAVVAQGCRDERSVHALMTGMAIGLCFQAALVVWQRVGLGMFHATGTFGHQNSLGLVSHFVTLPWFALLLGGQRGWQPVATPLAGATIAVLTASRATLGLAGLGLGALFGLSGLRRWTSRKAAVGFAGVVAMLALSPIAISSIERRYAEIPTTSDYYDERAAFERAAAFILADHPMGVGANNYVVVANTGGYLDRAGVIPVSASRSAPVHNAYWLTAAETGYLGIVAFALLLIHPLATALICGWRARKDPRGDLLLGCGVALLTVYVHCFFEWIFFTEYVQYMFAITVGLVAGLAQQLGYWRVSRRSSSLAFRKTPLNEIGRVNR